MNIVDMFANIGHWGQIMLVAGCIMIVGYSWARMGFYFWYVFIFIIGFLFAYITGRSLYFYSFLIGVLVAFSEIIGKFSDEPIKSLRTIHAVIYHAANGFISALALKLIILQEPNGEIPQEPLEQVKIVFGAGLGSMAFMRSKIFTMKIGGEDIAFGPEQLITVYLSFMEKAIDRVRAISRMDFITGNLKNTKFDQLSQFALVMLDSSQVIHENDKKEIIDEAARLAKEDLDEQLRSYKLGFILLNKMGEDFITRLVANRTPEWNITCPIPEANPGWIASIPFYSPKTRTSILMVYGSSMASRRLKQRLGWSSLNSEKFREITKPKNCILKGYKLAFSTPQADDPAHGYANIEENSEAQVEGVAFEFTEDAIKFMDTTEEAYTRRQVPILIDGKDMTADIYIAKTRRDGLTPTPEYLDVILEGAREFKLSSEYIEKLQSFQTEAPSAELNSSNIIAEESPS